MPDPSPLFGELLLRLGVITPSQRDQALALQQSTGQRIGEALVALGYVTRGQLSTALMDSLGLTPQSAGGTPPPVGELLVGLKHITRAQLEQCLEVQKRDGRRLGELLVEQGYCSYRQLYEALAMQHRGVDRPDVVRAPGKIRVLVVDDSPLARAFVEEGLTDKGYEVVCFEDPFTVLEEAPRLRPTIVLSDLEMPGMDGAELCRRLKDGPLRATPVIILTANDGETQKISGLRAGADDYVTKSASMEELSARIESVLRRTGETERIRKLFVRYTSDAVVDEILKNPEEIVLTGEKREATLLFADIRSFTALSESLPPEEVVRILNEVLGVLSDAVLTCGGTLDKFMGDGLMAVFGAPVSRPDDALRAMQAAEMMMEGMARLDAEHARAFEEGRRAVPARSLQLGIGVNTGPVVAGNLGSQLRTEYTCIGDAVNVAARLCALAGPGEILVGQRTHEVVGGGGRFEDLPPVRLKGKSQPVPLFRALWGDEPRRRAASDD